MASLFVDQLVRLDQAILPTPTRERWQPIRGGLLNLYLFDYEEFRYEQGHLLLRGNNGTGKSRVMAMQLPFLLDGRLASNRVEPDANPAKKMEWNLLMGRHGERTGYTWIEFGRLVQPGKQGAVDGVIPTFSGNGETDRRLQQKLAQQFVTLGCGLSATKASGMREPWFFVTDQRVGDGLFLQSEAGHPLSKSGLAEALGDRGAVYTTATDYRRAVDERLFGLGSRRYEEMVDLLIQLRKPQLSNDLDEKMLARVLREALPPPAETMVTDVAESFRGLETDRTELDRYRSACEGVDSFLKTYRRYAQIASRRRAADVRQSHSRYEAAGRELREAERESADAVRQLTKAIEELESLEIKHEELVAEIDTLRADPRMRSADEIREAAKYAKQAIDDFQAAQRELTNASERCELRRAERAEVAQQAQSQMKRTAELLHRTSQSAAECDFTAHHQGAFGNLRLHSDRIDGDPNSARQQIEEANERRLRACEKTKKDNDAVANARLELTRAKASHAEAHDRVEVALENQRAAEKQRRTAVDDFLESYRMWRRDSDELTVPSDEEISVDIDNWSYHTDEANPVALAVHKAEAEAQVAEANERAELQLQLVALTAKQTEAEVLAERLRQGFHELPMLPPFADDAGRPPRAGAAFWSLVDFAPTYAPTSRALIEAALEAAGFLNAWVMPDGSVLTSDFSDVLVSTDEATDLRVNPNVAEVLMPDASRDGASFTVPDSVIEGILQRVGYGVSDSTISISANGRWRNGLLHGHCHKEAAQYIGHQAREEQRLRRLVGVDAELGQIDEQKKELGRQLQYVEDRCAAIAKQAEAVPSDSGIRAAANAMQFAMRSLIEDRKSLTETERVVVDRQTKAAKVRENRDRNARDFGLTEWTDRVDDLIQRMGRYQRFLAELWPSIEHCESLAQQLAAMLTAVQDAEHDASLRDESLRERNIRRAREEQRLTTLRDTVGIDATAIEQQLDSAEGTRQSLQPRIKDARAAHTKAAEQVARTQERITLRKETISAESARRQETCVGFQRLHATGLLKTATGMQQEDASAWSVSRTVEVARQTEIELSQINADDAAWDRVQEAVAATIQVLNTALSKQAFTSTLWTADGLYRVTVPYQGQDRSVDELRELLTEEVRQRQLILDEREREIIEKHLIGEVAAKLHEQIHEAHGLVEQMNAEIQKRPMSTGMVLKFDWKPDEDLPNGIVEMCGKLLAATATWSLAERAAIGRYLQEHIKDVRASREAGTWHEHLAEALDYRRWHRFWVLRKQGSDWKRLTKRTHGTGSGGEKAVALTIPQFAAAAAHYSSARSDAPRLILLDEAFAGIDPDMRGKCMELINVFDLDFLLTSENEWGCYPGLPGVAIHQLSTRSGVEAVFLTRWIWNGKKRTRDEMPISPAARGNK